MEIEKNIIWEILVNQKKKSELYSYSLIVIELFIFIFLQQFLWLVRESDNVKSDHVE